MAKDDNILLSALAINQIKATGQLPEATIKEFEGKLDSRLARMKVLLEKNAPLIIIVNECLLILQAAAIFGSTVHRVKELEDLVALTKALAELKNP